MLVYTYDLTGAYLQTLEVDPFKPLPKRCTLEPAPEVSEGEIAFWQDAWEIHSIPLELETNLSWLRQTLKSQATAQRWQEETNGITLPNGVRIGTTTEDQNRITSVIANAKLAGVTSVDFKAASGWTTLTIEQVEGLAAAIALHVQACFSVERMHHEDIDSASFEDLQSYPVAAGWPSLD